jgi:hypothetical protein
MDIGFKNQEFKVKIKSIGRRGRLKPHLLLRLLNLL